VRVLITGSRTWADVETIRRALAEIVDSYPQGWDPRGIVLVHGGCNVRWGNRLERNPKGADAIAHTLWKSWGLEVDMHKAQWARHGRAAGPIRNKDMVDRGADLCLAFILDDSPGATDCARRARDAGIPVHEYRRTSEGTSDNAGGKAQRGPRRRRQGDGRGNRRNREGRPPGGRTLPGTGGESLRDPA